MSLGLFKWGNFCKRALSSPLLLHLSCNLLFLYLLAFIGQTLQLGRQIIRLCALHLHRLCRLESNTACRLLYVFFLVFISRCLGVPVANLLGLWLCRLRLNLCLFLFFFFLVFLWLLYRVAFNYSLSCDPFLEEFCLLAFEPHNARAQLFNLGVLLLNL